VEVIEVDILGSVENRRDADRVRMLKSGFVITVDGTRRESCVVNNLSESGALLVVEQPKQLPDELIVIIDGENVRRPAHITRRHRDSVAVSFVTKQANSTKDSGWVFPPEQDNL